MKANWIGHILRKKCFLKRVIEEKVRNARQGRRRKQLLDDLRKTGGYWKLIDEAPCRTLWRIRFGRGYGPVARRAT